MMNYMEWITTIVKGLKNDGLKSDYRNALQNAYHSSLFIIFCILDLGGFPIFVMLPHWGNDKIVLPRILIHVFHKYINNC